MVVQSGDGSTGGKDTKPVKTPAPWKYILIAAILAASILGIFFAATTGIFNNNPTPDASTNPISGASQPATNPGLVLTDNDDKNKITKATKIPNPNEITPAGTLIGISNPQEFIQTSFYGLAITDIEIDKSNNEIKACYLNTNPEKSIIIRPALINFFNKDKNNIFREQWCCRYFGNNDQAEFRYGNGYAHCQWPEDFCYVFIATENGRDKKLWKEYWEEKSGKKQQPQKVGSTKYNEQIIPTIKPEGKYSFAISCEIPSDTMYIKIT